MYRKNYRKIRLRSLHIMNLLICFFLLASNFPIQSTHATFLPFFPCIFDAFSCELIKLSDLYWAVFPLFPIISVRTAVIVVCFICTNCLSLRDNAACCIPLRYLRNLRENIHIRVLNLYCTNETPEVSRRSRRFTQTKPKTTKQQ